MRSICSLVLTLFFIFSGFVTAAQTEKDPLVIEVEPAK